MSRLRRAEEEKAEEVCSLASAADRGGERRNALVLYSRGIAMHLELLKSLPRTDARAPALKILLRDLLARAFVLKAELAQELQDMPPMAR